MYFGTVTVREKQWATRFVQGIGRYGRDESYCVGVVQVERHAYRCDQCGRQFNVVVKADEPFFCDCNSLISIAAQSEQQVSV